MQIRVYKSRYEEVEKTLNALAKKAERYSVPFAWSRGADEVMEVTYRAGYDAMGNRTTVKVRVVPIEVSEEMIQADGWTAVAMIEHCENGNVVTMFDRAASVPEAWRTVASHCDHCGVDRARKFTYMVRNEQGELRQVGSTCLKDYTGIDPRFSLLWAMVCAVEMAEDDVRDEGWFEAMRQSRVFDVRDVLAAAVDSIKARGYVRSSDIGATKDDVLNSVQAEKPSNEAYEKADKIIAWVGGTEIGEVEIAPVVKDGFCSTRHFGRLCYLPVAYDIAMDRARREAEHDAAMKAAREASRFVGEVGEKVSFRASDAQYVTSFDGMYGMTHLYKMVDEQGNVFVWYASRLNDVGAGKMVTGTVKAHKEYDGVQQTVITRCKIA